MRVLNLLSVKNVILVIIVGVIAALAYAGYRQYKPTLVWCATNHQSCTYAMLADRANYLDKVGQISNEK